MKSFQLFLCTLLLVALTSTESKAQQHFEPKSNFNMLRATDNMKTTNQVLMHLDKKEMIVYVVPGQCRYQGMTDKCPDGYDHSIKIRVMEYPEGNF